MTATAEHPHVRDESQPEPLKFRPLSDRVVVEPIFEEEDKPKNERGEEILSYGIVKANFEYVEDPMTGQMVPKPKAQYRPRPEEGIVRAVGPGRRYPDGTLVPIDVKIGQRVYFQKHAGDQATIDGKMYFILDERHIRGEVLP